LAFSVVFAENPHTLERRKMKKHKALVSGATGFIGSHLVKRLLGMGWEVKCLTQGQFYDTKPIKGDYDYIFHLAAYGQHFHQRDDVDEIYRANVFGTLNLLERTKDIKYKAFINFGTSSEYGVKNKPMKETDLVEPTFFYASSKVASTALCQAWSHEFDKNIVTVRPFSIYGPGEADFRFIPKLINSQLTGEVFKLSSGVHDWICIEDFIDGLLLVAENAKKLKGKVVNIGTGKQYTNQEVVDTLAKYIRPIYYEPGQMRPNDTKGCWRADNRLLKSLGWKQKHTLSEGLGETIQYYLPE
jgi:nucleoside-diphosphate-sugar epimerase